MNATSSGICVGRAANNTGKLVINPGGSVNASIPVLVAFQSASGVLNISGGTVSLTGAGVAGDLALNAGGSPSAATVIISGGTTTIGATGAVNFGGGGSFSTASSGTGILNMTGGALYVGGGGIVKSGAGTYTNSISLSGGTVGARADWSSVLPMTLGGANGNIFFQAANSTASPFNISLGGVLSGTGGFTKTGAGSLTLSAGNTYSGNTVISAGTLVLTGTGNIANSAVIDIRSGASLDVSSLASPFNLGYGKTLTGSGTVNGAITAAGTIAPGTGIGTLTTGAATLAGNLLIEVNGALADKLVTNGNLNLAGAALYLSLTGSFNGPYVIAQSNGGVLTGSFASVPAGYRVTYSSTQAILTNYTSWAAANGIAGASFRADSDGDGIPNGIEFVVGGNPSSADARGLLPTIAADATYFTFVFRRTAISANYNPCVEYGSTLSDWTPAQAGVNGVIINETGNAFTGGDSVEVKLPRALALPGARLFVRLQVVAPAN